MHEPIRRQVGSGCTAGSDTTGDCRVRPSGAEARAIRGEFLFRFPFLYLHGCPQASAAAAAAAPVPVHTPLATVLPVGIIARIKALLYQCPF